MSPATTDKNHYSFARNLSSFLGYIVFGLAVWGLIGWKYVVPDLDARTVKLVVMTPVGALIYMLTGVALWSLQEKRVERFRTFGMTCLAAAFALSVISLAIYLLNLNIRLDMMILRLLGAEGSAPNLFGLVITTRVSLIVVHSALLLLQRKNASLDYAAQVGLLVVGTVGLASLIGYLYSLPTLYLIIESHWVMALPTAVILVCVSLAVLLLRPDRGFVPMFVGGAAWSMAARRYLLFSIVFPFAVGAVLVYAQRIVRVPTEESILLFAIMAVLLSFVMIYVNSRKLEKSEEAARFSELRYRELIETANSIIVRWSVRGEIVFINDFGLRFFGYSSDELLGRPFMTLFPKVEKDTGKDMKEMLRDIVTDTENHAYVPSENVRKDGLAVWVAWTNKAIPDAMGNIAEILAIGNDITELKKMQQRLETSNMELEQFAYVASHDLQEPLRMISSYTELFERRYQGELDERARKYMNYIVEGAKRMQRLIQDLLVFSRVGRMDTARRPVDCNAVIDAVVTDMHEQIIQENATVTRDAMPVINAGETNMRQLFQNLIGNAIKFHRENVPPRVHVSARNTYEGWLFSVNDNGMGIEPRYFEKIFVIFQRLHSRNEYPGTGIGLAICKKIVATYGGKIWVESQPGEGSTFYFTIPQPRDRDSSGAVKND